MQKISIPKITSNEKPQEKMKIYKEKKIGALDIL